MLTILALLVFFVPLPLTRLILAVWLICLLNGAS